LNEEKKMAITPVGQTSNNVQTDNNVSGVTDAAITQDNGPPIERYDNGHNCYALAANRGCPEEGPRGDNNGIPKDQYDRNCPEFGVCNPNLGCSDYGSAGCRTKGLGPDLIG
jgi:hypothetical protein